MAITAEEKQALIEREKTCYPTMSLRRYRPAGASDNEIVLQQLFMVSRTGDLEWRDVPLVMED